MTGNESSNQIKKAALTNRPKKERVFNSISQSINDNHYTRVVMICQQKKEGPKRNPLDRLQLITFLWRY